MRHTCLRTFFQMPFSFSTPGIIMDSVSVLLSVASYILLTAYVASDLLLSRPPQEINPDLLRPSTEYASPCQNDTWAYSNITGSCYMFVDTETDLDGNPLHVSYEEAIEMCHEEFPQVIGGDENDTKRIELLFIEDADEQSFLETQLLRFNYAPHWLGARRNTSTGTFQWSHDLSDVTFKRWDVGEPSGEPSRDCVYIHKPHGLQKEWRWKTTDCLRQKPFAVYCKQSARRCSPIPTADFLRPSFPKPNIEQTIEFQCLPGYQMPDYEAEYVKWEEDKAANLTNATEPMRKVNPTLQLNCTYSGQWEPSEVTQAVAPCEPLSCDAVPTVKYAKANDTVTRIYPTWTEFTCSHGHYFKDINSRLRIGWCGSDVRWHNLPRECDPVPCEPFETPDNATSDNDHLTFFGDVIAYKCLPGYMYPDGTVWRFVACRQNYVDELVGRWNETELPDCEPLECPEPPTGEHVNQTGNSTEHRARINYTCVDGYEFPDSSTSVLLECSDDAVWKPKLPKAAEKPVPLPVTGKRYQPPTVDAPGASSIGNVAMVICILMLVILVLLDMATISRDVKLLRNNLKHLKRRLLARRKQHSS